MHILTIQELCPASLMSEAMLTEKRRELQFPPQIVDKVVSAYKRWSHFVLLFQKIK